jgi:S-adenosylmethionine/arginine decarboxylase-like enzyme
MPDVDGGKTVRIILRGCDAHGNGGLSDPSLAQWAILNLCEFLGMTRVGDPVVRALPPGLSCGLVIAESHLFIHTWPETASVRVIIDSCADFDHNVAADRLQMIFGAERYEYSIA